MEIQQCKYQYAKPQKYNGETRGTKYKIETEWHQYYNAEFRKNYFIEDELEFLKALREDLQHELDELDKDISRNIKVREKALK